MARLWSGALTFQDSLADGFGQASTAFETTRVPMSGLVGERFSNFGESVRTFSGALATTYYAATLLDIETLQSGSLANCRLLHFIDRAFINITDAGVVQLRNGGTSAQIGSNGPTISTDNHVLLELAIRINSSSADDYAEARVNGVSFASSNTLTISTTAPSSVSWGMSETLGTPGEMYHSCITLNDSTGAAENTWPGLQYHRVSLWTADVSRGVTPAWKGGGGGTSNIGAATDNIPPAGRTEGAMTDSSQIKNETASNTDDYTADFQSYTTIGVRANDSVKAVQEVVVTGSNNNTDTAGQLQIVSNPAEGAPTALTSFESGVQANTHPTGWTRQTGPVNHNPTVTKGSAIRLLVGKQTSTTRDAYVDAMGALVSWTPATSAVFSQAVLI